VLALAEAFRKIFLNALKRSLITVISDPAVQAKIRERLPVEASKQGVSKKELLANLNDAASYAFGSLAADIALAAIMEGADEAQKLQKLLADVVLEAASDKGLSDFLDHCNVQAGKSRFGEEDVERIAEEVTTTTIYETPEFNTFTEGLKKLVEQALA
jgi:hypothetical protein